MLKLLGLVILVLFSAASADKPVRLPAPTVTHCEAMHGHWYDGACWSNYGR